MVNKVWKARLKLWMSHGEKYTEPEIILGPMQLEVKNATILDFGLRLTRAMGSCTGREIIFKIFLLKRKKQNAGFFKFLLLT